MLAGANTLTLKTGTDHPFFPPLSKSEEAGEQEKWISVDTNYQAIKEAFQDLEPSRGASKILGQNAIRLLNLN